MVKLHVIGGIHEMRSDSKTSVHVYTRLIDVIVVSNADFQSYIAGLLFAVQSQTEKILSIRYIGVIFSLINWNRFYVR